MYTLKDGETTIIFSRKEDYDWYKDYLQNGLKVIKKEGRKIYFNDRSYLINVSRGRDDSEDDSERYILKRGNYTYRTEKYISKYITAMKVQF